MLILQHRLEELKFRLMFLTDPEVTADPEVLRVQGPVLELLGEKVADLCGEAEPL